MKMRTRLSRTAALGFAATLVVAACAGDGDGAEELTGQGFEECRENPNNCNSGERVEGGSITWIVQEPAEGWLAISPDAGSVYTLQAIHGILPHTGQWEPDGVTYKFNLDLLEDEPELLSDGSDEPFSYQFRIRDEAVWDDDTPITADDFAILWRMSASEEEGHCIGCRSRSSAIFDQIESIVGSDDGKTVTITLKEGERDPEWFSYGSAHNITGGIPPAHLAAQNDWDINDPAQLGEYFEWLHETRPTYSGGPYRIVDGDMENRVIMEPNENWYGDVQPTMDTHIVRFITDQGAWVPALGNDEVHGGSPIQLNQDIIQQLDGMPNVMVTLGPGPSWEHLDFNMDVPEFADIALRRAIFTAVDVADIAERNLGQLYPDYTIRTNHVFPATSNYHVDYVTETGQGSGDTELALEILEDAGYQFDGSTLTLDGEQIGPFRLRATADPLRVTSMELIQAQLAQIGIDVTIETTGTLGATLQEQDYDIIQFGWSGSPFFTGTVAQLWSTGSGNNFGNYSNEQVDELGQLKLTAASLDEAAEHANAAVELLVEDATVLPLYDTPVYLFVTNEYINVRDNGATSLRGLYEHHTWGIVAE